MTDPEWVQLPVLLAHDDFRHLMNRFDELGVVSRHRAFDAAVTHAGAGNAYCVQVQPSDALAVARALREFWDIEDPASDTPYSGPCAACGEEVQAAWTCPSCGISFCSRLRKDDPVVVFIRDHGGFAPS